VNGRGDGDTSPDWIVLDDPHVLLRVERAGNGNGRIYTITITCVDSGGNSSSEQVEVMVPHDRGRYWVNPEKGKAPLLFFFNGAAPSEIYTLSLHDALPI